MKTKSHAGISLNKKLLCDHYITIFYILWMCTIIVCNIVYIFYKFDHISQKAKNKENETKHVIANDFAVYILICTTDSVHATHMCNGSLLNPWSPAWEADALTRRLLLVRPWYQRVRFIAQHLLAGLRYIWNDLNMGQRSVHSWFPHCIL